jgi:hypothetical protein
MSKPQIKITSRKQDINKQEKNIKPTHSNFFIDIKFKSTIHKNEHKENIENDMEIFDKLINEMLNHIEQYIRLPENVQYNDENIKDVSADYVVEVGSIKKQIHAHIMLKFKHFTRIQLNYIKFKEYFKRKLGLKNMYIQGKLLNPSASENIVDYLNKMVLQIF